MENHSGLVAQVCLTQASGTAERGAALVLVDRLARRQQITLGADKGHDVLSFVFALRSAGSRRTSQQTARSASWV